MGVRAGCPPAGWSLKRRGSMKGRDLWLSRVPKWPGNDPLFGVNEKRWLGYLRWPPKGF